MDQDTNMKNTGKQSKLSGARKYIAAAAAVMGVLCAVNAMTAAPSAPAGETADNAAVFETAEAADIISEELAPEQISAAAADRLSWEIGTGNILTEKYLKITVVADGEEKPVYTAAGSTVADVLNKAGIELDNDDIVSEDLEEKLESDCTVTVNRIEFVNGSYVRTYKFKTEYREDDTILEGETETLTEGEDGEVLIETLTRLVDGEVDEIEVVSKDITKPAVNEVILKGTLKAGKGAPAAVAEDAAEDTDSDTANDNDDIESEEIFADEDDKPATKKFVSIDPPMHSGSEVDVDIPEDIFLDEDVSVSYGPDYRSKLEVPEWLELDENGIPVSYSNVLTGRSCAYTAKPTALMSTGKAVFQGYVAVDPRVIPYGTEMYIIADDGTVYGYAIAADTGTTVRRGKIVVDLFMNEYDDCIQWGNRAVSVYILNGEEEAE